MLEPPSIYLKVVVQSEIAGVGCCCRSFVDLMVLGTVGGLASPSPIVIWVPFSERIARFDETERAGHKAGLFH